MVGGLICFVCALTTDLQIELCIVAAFVGSVVPARAALFVAHMFAAFASLYRRRGGHTNVRARSALGR